VAVSVLARGAVAAGQAGLTLTAPSGGQSISTPFDVTLSISRADATWAGYNAQIAYDSSVLQVKDVQMVKIADCNDSNWAAIQTTPTVVVTCVFQESTETGPVDTITFQCLKDGASELHLVTLAEDSIQGSQLFDFNAETIPTDLVDGPIITCGAGGPVATVPIPTNPPQSDVQTAIAGGGIVTPAPGGTTASGTPAPGGTASGTEGTPGSAGTSTSSGTAGAGKTAAPGGTAAGRGTAAAGATAGSSVLSAPARTSTAAARALTGDNSSDSGSSNTGLIIAIIVVVVVVGGAGAGFMYWRSRTAGR
jgi:hypothetical protein